MVNEYEARLPNAPEYLVKAKKVNGRWFAGGDVAPEGTMIKLDTGVYILNGCFLKFQDVNW